MKIGLVGAPGSGKSEVARSLARQLEAQGGRYLPVAVVDDYVAEVEDTHDLACGFLASYVADMAVVTTRFGRERQAAREGAQTIITCGTLAETATYTAINLTLQQDEYSWAVANVTMPYYAVMSRSIMAYDFVFFLPLRDSDIDLHNALDHEVLGSLQALAIPYGTLVEREAGDMATEALGLIEAAR